MKSLYVILIMVGLAGCSQKLPLNEYLKWVENEKNGLLVKRSIDGNELILQYQPIEYVAIMNLRQGGLDEKNFHTEVTGLNGYHYFSFKLKPTVSVNANQDYFNYQLEGNFLLIQGSDSMKCAFFHQESTRNFSPYMTFLLAFKKKQTVNRNLVFQYTDEIFGLNTIKIEIDKARLKNIPSLKFESYVSEHSEK